MTRRTRREAQASIVRQAQQHQGRPVTRSELAGEFKKARRSDLDAVVEAGKVKRKTYRRPWRADEYAAVPAKRKHWWSEKPDPWGSEQ